MNKLLSKEKLKTNFLTKEKWEDLRTKFLKCKNTCFCFTDTEFREFWQIKSNRFYCKKLVKKFLKENPSKIFRCPEKEEIQEHYAILFEFNYNIPLEDYRIKYEFYNRLIRIKFLEYVIENYEKLHT